MDAQKKITLAFLLLAAWLLFACERFYFESGKNANQIEIFEEAWQFVDREYAYFDLKGVDWNLVKSQFKPLVSENISNDSLFNVIANMLDVLKDGHNNLTSPFNRSRSWDWFLNYPENYNFEIIERHYLKNKQRYLGGLIFLDLDSLAYISYRSFNDEITDDNLKMLSRIVSNKKGIIIDIRNNSGGSLNNAYKLASFFTENNYTAGTEVVKNGPNHNDFSAAKAIEVTKFEIENSNPFLGKVALLINRKTYSAGTFFSMFMQANPRCVLIGDQTGGGGGAPAYTELQNGWSLRVSGTQTIDVLGNHIELGVMPNIFQNLTKAQTDLGKDDIIERAIAELNS